MTQAQEAAFEKARRILSEHFDAHVLAIRYDDETGDSHMIDFAWDARLSEAVGLAYMLSRKLDMRIVESSKHDQT